MQFNQTCFASSSGTSRRSAHRHCQGLGQSNVTSIGQRSYDKSLSAADELILIDKVNISYGYQTPVGVLAKIKSNLFQPFEV